MAEPARETRAAAGAGAAAASTSLLAYVLLTALAVFWGSNWPAMKIAVQEIPPWTFRSLCLAFGGGALLLIARLGGASLVVPRAERWPLAFASLFNVTGWYLFTAFGLLTMGAGRAVIVAYTMPLWVTLLSAPLLGEPVTPRKLVALAMGLAGLALLLVPEIGRLGAAPLGALHMLGAAVTWAIGTVLVKRVRWSIGTLELSGWQLLVGGIPVFLGAALLEMPVDLARLSGPGIVATLYTVLVAMTLGQWLWFRIVRLLPASVGSIGSLAVPAVGVMSSAFVLGEPVGLPEIGSLVLVVAAVAIVLLRANGRR